MPDPQQQQTDQLGSVVDNVLGNIRQRNSATATAEPPAPQPQPQPAQSPAPASAPQQPDPSKMPLDQWVNGMLGAIRHVDSMGLSEDQLPATMRNAGTQLAPEERDFMVRRMKEWGVAPRRPPEEMTDGELKTDFQQIEQRLSAQQEWGGKSRVHDQYSDVPLMRWYQQKIGEPLQQGAEKYAMPVLESILNDPSALADPTQAGKLASEATQYATMTDEDRKAVNDRLVQQNPTLAKISQAYSGAAHGAAKGAVDFLADPINWALMVAMGPAAKAAPLLGFAADTIFSGMMGKGLWDSGVDAGHKLANGDVYGAFTDIGSAPMQAYFLSHGMDKFSEQVRNVRLIHNLDDAAQSTYEKPFKELDPQQRLDVTQTVLKTLSSPKYLELAKSVLAGEQAKDMRKVGEAYERLQQGEEPSVRDDLADRAKLLLQYQKARGLETSISGAPPHLESLYLALNEGSLARQIDAENSKTLAERQSALEAPPTEGMEAAGANQAQQLMAQRRTAEVNRAVQDMLQGKTPTFYDEEVRGGVDRTLERIRLSNEAKIQVENQKTADQSPRLTAEANKAAEPLPPPTADELAQLRERIQQRTEQLSQEQGFRDVGRRESEGEPAILQPPPGGFASSVPLLEGSPLTPEQRFAEAEADAWKLVNEGRADEAMHLLAMYDEYLREQPEVRGQRFKDQEAGEYQRLADQAEAEEERISSARGFRDLGRKPTGEEAPQPATEPIVPPPLQPEPEVLKPPPGAPGVPSQQVREDKFEDVGSVGTLPAQSGALVPVLWGERGEAVTPTNSRVKYQYGVVPAADVNTSFDSAFNVNPSYPAELQPRDRLRAASQDQFRALTSPGPGQLDFLRMAENPNSGDGAPVVGTDLNAETRNMGATVLKTLYDRESPIAAKYREDLLQNASKYGISPEEIAKIQNPVLVRVRRTSMDGRARARFAEDSNVATTARMAASEQAKSDAQKISSDVLGSLRPTDDGTLNNVANADFVRAFFDAVVPQSERGAYMQPDGSLSVDGVQRLRNALFAKAYPGADSIMAQMTESPDSNIRNVQNAMHNAAPRFAIMQDMIDRGILYDFGITDDIADAAKKLSELKKSGKSVDDYLLQTGLGFGDMPAAARELLRAINEKGRSVKGLTQILSDYADTATSRARKDQAGLFGSGPAVTKEDILRAATQRNVLLDFGDGGAPPQPEPAPLKAIEKPPAVSLTAPPAEPSIEYAPSNEIHPAAADIARHEGMLEGLGQKKLLDEAVASNREIKSLKKDYELVRGKGLDGVLKALDAEAQQRLAASITGRDADEISPEEAESIIRDNAGDAIRSTMKGLQSELMETRARELAALKKAGRTEEGPPEEQPEREDPGRQKTPQDQVFEANYEISEMNRRLLDPRASAEDKEMLRTRIEQYREMVRELEKRTAPPESEEAIKETQQQQFKASKKGGLAFVGVTADGRETIFREFSKDFAKKNRDKLVAQVNKSEEPLTIVDEKGNVLAQSDLWKLRHSTLANPDQLRAMPDADLRKSLDEAQAKLGHAEPGSAMHTEFTSAVASMEDEVKRRQALEAPKPGFGAENALVTESDKNEALKRIMQKMSGTAYSGIDPEILADAAKIGAYYFEAGFREVSAWTQEMVKALGEKIRPYLDEAWARLVPEARRIADEKMNGADDETKSKLNEKMSAFDQKQQEVASVNPSRSMGAGSNEGLENKGSGSVPPNLSEAAKPEVRPEKPATPGDGTGTRRAKSPVSIVSDAPARERGPWTVDPEKWRAELRANNMSEIAPGPTLRVSPDVDKMLIYRPQKPIVEAALTELEHGSGAFVVASSTGTGKTHVASAIIKETLDRNPGQQFHVVLTKNQELVRVFKNTLAEFGIEGQDLPSGVSAPPEPGVYVTTYATMRNRPGIENFPWHLAVYDESSELRNWQISQQGAMGKTMGRSAEKNLYLSATPFSSPVELGYLEPLGLWRKQGFENWARQFGVYRDKDTGLLAGGNAPLKLAAFRKQLIERGQFMNLDTDLSGHKFSVGVVPLEEKNWEDLRNIDQAFSMAENYFTMRKQARMMMATRAAKVNFFKAYLERTRLPQAIELMKKLDAAGHKVAIFSETMAGRDEPYDFLQEADKAMGGRLSQMLPPLPSVYDTLHAEFGDQISNLSGGGNKTEEIANFNSGAAKHIFATYQKGGMGVSLHDTTGEAPRAAIYLGPPWSGMLLQQGLGRIWRYGTKSDAYSIILGSDSAAEYNTITQRVVDRLDSMHALVSGIDKENPTIRSMRSIEDAADYANGNEDPNADKEFVQRVDPRGIANYKDIAIPNAADNMNKGLQVERRDIAPPPGSAGVTLYSGFDPIRAAQAAADLARSVARLGTKIKSIFGRGDQGVEPPPDPGDPDQRAIDLTVGTPSARRLSTEAFENEEPGTKEAFADSAQALARSMADGSAGDPTPAVVGAWRGAIDLLRDTKSTGGNMAKTIGNFIVINGRMLIAQRGGDIGREIAYKMIPDYQITQGNIAGPWENRAFDIVDKYGLSKEEWSNLHYSVEGLAAPVNDRVAAAVPEVRKLKADMAAKLREEGVTTEIRDHATGRMRYSLIGEDPNYMQRIYDPKVFQPGSATREKIVQQIMSRDGVTKDQAELRVDRMRRDVPLAGTVERPREFDIPGYRTDFNSFLQGIEQSAEAIARTRVFGQRREKLSGLISMIPEAENRKVINDTADQLLKRSPWMTGPNALLTGATNWAVFTKMTTSAIPMMSHWLKPALYTNMGSFADGLVKTIMHYPQARREAIDVGSLMRQTRLGLYKEMGIQNEGAATKLLHYTGFTPMDTFGRVLATATAQSYMEKYALPRLIDNPGDATVRRILQDKFQIPDTLMDKAIGDRAWGRDAIARGSKAYTDLTMFTNDPTELPGIFRFGSDSEAGQTAAALTRTALLLKSYTWKNTYLFHDALMAEARKGNFKPWVPFLAMFPAVGFAINALRTATRGDTKKLDELFDSESYTPSKILKTAAYDAAFYASTTSLSTMTDAIDSNRSLGEWVLGPSITDSLRGVQTGVRSVQDLLKGDPDKFEHKWQSYARSTFVPLHPFIPKPPRAGEESDETGLSQVPIQ